MTFEEIKKEFLHKEWPVWWDTGDGREAGDHRAIVLHVLPYTGRYDFIACIFELTPSVNCHYPIQMSIEKTDIKHAMENR